MILILAFFGSPLFLFGQGGTLNLELDCEAFLGLEVEDMELDGYRTFDEELVEDWGVETSGTGRASGVFEEASGVYVIKISYFDQEGEKSKILLYVNGQRWLNSGSTKTAIAGAGA